MPDQYNFTTYYPGKTAAQAEPLLFSGKTLTEVVNAAYTEFGITYFSFNSTDYTYGTNTLNMCSLDQFIDESSVNSQTPLPKGLSSGYLDTEGLDARELYACCPVSNMDGFSIRTKFLSGKYLYGDLSFRQFSTDGYVATVVSKPQLWWPNGTDSASPYAPYAGWASNLYACSYPYDIYLFRIIDVVRSWENELSATTTVNKNRTARFEVEATSDSYVTGSTLSSSTFNVTTLTVTVDGETYSGARAISLDQFITTYVMALSDAQASTTTFAINNLKGDSTATSLSYSDLQDAYFLPDYNILVLDYSGSPSQIYFPTKIVVTSTDITANGSYTGYSSTYSSGYLYASYPVPAFAVYPGE